MSQRGRFPERRPSAADSVPPAGGEARPGCGGGGILAGWPELFSGPRRPGSRGRQAWVMAGAAAQPGPELLDFAAFRDSSTQPVVYGYGQRSLRELRAREFRRLEGEAGGATCAQLAGRP